MQRSLHDMHEIRFGEYLTKHSDIELGITVNSGDMHYASEAQKAFEEGDYQSALIRINKAIAISSKSWGKDIENRSEYTSLQDFEKINKTIEIPTKMVDDLEKMFSLKGKICLSYKNYPKSIAAFIDALTLNKNSYEGLLLIGLAYSLDKKFKESIVVFTKFIKNYQHVVPNYLTGNSYQFLYDFDNAMKDFKEILAMDKENKQAEEALLLAQQAKLKFIELTLGSIK